MAMIITSRPRHLMGDQVEEEILRFTGTDDGYQISDACALTIASWWQSPGKGTHGAVMAQLASTGRVDRDEIIEAAEYERGFARSGLDDEGLCALIDWAEHMCKLCGHIVRNVTFSDSTLKSETDGVSCPTTRGEIIGHQL